MGSASQARAFRRRASPRAAAVAGVLFAVLFATTLTLLRTALPESLAAAPNWLRDGSGSLAMAIAIMPFAGIAFLYFIGVLRDTFGEAEDKLVVRYSPRVARWIAEREGKRVADDGCVVVEYPLADLRWAVRHVLQYGPDAEVLSPPRVRDEIRRRLQALTGRGR